LEKVRARKPSLDVERRLHYLNFGVCELPVFLENEPLHMLDQL
jgi:hypothetical protein